ncbi:hypothetical protein Tco_1093648 [Tanacetum coccineum]|uniref:Uncharacterized protein n=1 Tax=Tanacetum coccineum TaxID=301880 RepID=A0ABQ5IEK7_9ASTR
MEPGVILGRHLTQEEAAKEALALRISQRFALLEEVRPVPETMAYNDKYKKVLDEIWKDKVELDGMIAEEEEEAINKVKGEALKEKDGPGAFIFPIRLVGKVNENALADTRSDVLRIAESNSNDEEEYEIKINKFGAPMYGLKPTAYLNCNDPAKRSSALQAVINPFRKISVWKKAVSSLGSLPVRLQHVDWKPDYKGCYTNKEEAKGKWRTEIRLTGPYGNIYVQAFTTKKTGQKLLKYHKLWEETMIKPDHQERSRQYETMEEVLLPQVHHEFLLWEGCNREAKSSFSISFIQPMNLMKFVLMMKFQTKKIIKFRLGGRAHSLTLLEFARRLGLYHADKLNEEGFDVYFQGGLRSDEHFNAQEYWLSVSREENLSLSRSYASTIRGLILRVMHKMITYGLCQRTIGYDKIQKNDLWLLSMFDARHQNGYANVAWLIAIWMKRKGAGTKKASQICCGQFSTKLARKVKVLSDEVLRSLSVSIYYRDLDTTILRELIDSEGRLNPEDPHRELLFLDLQEHRCRTLFEHMVGVYSVPLQGAYNPPGYAQSQCAATTQSTTDHSYLPRHSLVHKSSTLRALRQKRQKEKGNKARISQKERKS